MKTAMKYYQNPKNKAQFMEKYDGFFENPNEVYTKILNGNTKDQDVVLTMLAELAEFQPISLGQQSQKYLTAGNGRVFWSLKSFGLRTVSASVREGYEAYQKGNKVEGAVRFGSLIMLYAMAGAGTDELKDLLRGKDSDFNDNVWDNVIQLFMINKFSLEKGIQGDSLITSVVHNLIPPFRWADNFWADATSPFTDKDFKFKSLNNVPLVGSWAYSWSPQGQETSWTQYKRDISEEIKENKKAGRGAFAGDVERKMNTLRKAAPDLKMSRSDVMKTYKRKEK